MNNNYYKNKIKILLLLIFLAALSFFAIIALEKISEHFNQPLNKLSGKNDSDRIKNGDSKTILLVKDKEIIVSIADTPEKQIKGLSGINYLEENRGMLFVFQKPRNISSWNKDTFIPLDVIWIRNGKIIKIDYLPSVKEKGLVILNSPGEIDWVLEANAGWSGENDIKTGDEIRFKIVLN